MKNTLRTAAVFAGGGMFLPLVASAQVSQDGTTIISETDNHIPNSNNTLELSPEKFIHNPKSFITEISKISGKNTNLDSLYNLPPAELRKFSQQAMRRPTIVEVGTVKLKKSDNYKLVTANYDPVFNFIKLKIFELGDEYLSLGAMGEDVGKLLDQKSWAQAQCDALNAELFYRYVHEEDHSRKYRLQYDASLTVSQILQFRFHLEVSARIAVNIARKELDSVISDKEIDPMFRDAISDFDKVAELYKGDVHDDMQNTTAISLSEQYLTQKARMRAAGGNGPKDYDTLIGQVYSFNINGRNRNILDLIGPETTALLLSNIRSYVSDKLLAAQVKEVSQSLEPLVRSGAGTRQAFGIIPENSRYDTDNLNKTIRSPLALEQSPQR